MRSLTTKLAASYLGVILLAIVVVTIWVDLSVRLRFGAFVEQVLLRQSTSLAARLTLRYLRTGERWSAADQMLANAAVLTHSDIWLYNAAGHVVLTATYRAGPAAPAPTPSAIGAILHGVTLHGHVGGLLPADVHAYAGVPIELNGAIIGAVYLAQVSGATDRPLRGPPADAFIPATTNLIVGGGLVAGLIAALIGARLAQTVTRPLREITQAVEQVAQGDYGQRLPVRTRDEVGQLAAACNRMAAELERDVGELRRQEELRRDLVANVSHDLSTPLTSIQGFTEALLDGVVRDETGRRATYQTIYAEVLRLRRLVDDLKNLSQYESGSVRILLQPLLLGPLVHEILRVEQSSADERHVTLEEAMPADLPSVLADGDRIGQVLLNLLDNALRATPPGGRVRVAASAESDGVWVEVADTGSGIAREHLPEIFERFYRVDPSRSAHTGGGGLGLAIVKAIIEAHSGTITAESDVGAGTRIRFRLPIVGPPSLPAVAWLVTPPENGHPTPLPARPHGRGEG